jgi:uncharacterized protein (TIGR03032 family)
MAEALQSQSTSSFAQFLQQAGISLAVSTYQAGKLIMMREDGGGLNTHFIEMEKPMGIALSGPRLTVGTGPYVIDHYNMPAMAGKIEPLERHDGCYLPRELHVTGDIDIHEMAFDGDDELWLVNTKMSCLCTLEREHSVTPRWRPPFISAYDLTDRCHLNGLAMKEGKPTWVTALGTTDTAGGWRDKKADGGILMEVQSGKIICEGLSMPHSPRWHEGKLWVLESGAGTLLEVDPISGKTSLVAELPGFCRGVDFVGRYAIIGLSQVRETAVFAGLPLTARCDERQCGVWIVDIVDKHIVGYMVFSGGVQEIFSVQILPERFPTLLELGHPLLHSSYSLPEAALTEVKQPDQVQVKMGQAMQLHQSGQLDKAADIWREVVEADESQQMARYHLGVTLSDLERWDEAITMLSGVVERDPNHAEAHNSLGHAWAGKFDTKQAMRAYDQAIEADQQYATAHFNRGLMLLKQGDFIEGWKGYEWRWGMPSFTPFNCPQSQWQGEDIGDKTLLVHTEQGNGDAIQFARFLPMVAKRCKKLIVVCVEPLSILFKQVEGVDEVRLPGSLPADLFDVYCPIMSLAGILAITLDNLPADAPYLTIPETVIVPTLADSKKLKVGIAWAGSATHATDKHRSCGVEAMSALADNTDCDFYSLQVPISQPNREQLQAKGITDLEAELTSYAHTAALIAQLDLVISVDTSVAHLAAALNKPTWILIAANSDWRWLESRTDSPWYPSVKLFRQKTPKEWDDVVGEISQALKTVSL